MQIEGHAAIVAGGASGLGEATSRALVERGAHVTIADLNEEKGAALAGELGPNAPFVRATSPTRRRSPQRSSMRARRRRAADRNLLRRDRLGRAHGRPSAARTS